MRYFITTIFIGVILLFTTNGIAEKFPYRSAYPDVDVIELDDLKSGYDNGDFIIVDLRSKTEFDIIHIKDAINVPYANARFTSLLQDVTDRFPTKKVAVYDNGNKCLKSYRAFQDAEDEGISNVFAFDGGISSWALAYPGETLLLGSVVKNPDTQLISEENIKSKCLDFEIFRQMSANENTLVLDIRDPIQRTKKLQGLEGAIPISVDKIVRNIISKEHMKDKKLLIFDQVGNQVKWLMYHLVNKGYDNFHFLEGGATSVLKVQNYRVASVR